MRIVIFISGAGSNMQAIARSAQAGQLNAEITMVVCDNPKAEGIEAAKNLGLKVKLIDWDKNTLHSLITDLYALNIDYIVLAGFMRILPAYFVDAFDGKIINIHPSLLPKYPGLKAIWQNYQAGDDIFGITIHYVDHGVDTGNIIAQASFKRKANDTLETITKKIHGLEHVYYSKILQKLHEEG